MLAAKVESTIGTAETLAAADADYFVRNLEVSVEADEQPREYQGTASPNADAIGARMVTLTFDIECHGKGSAGVPDWASVFLTACGMYDDSNTMKLATAAPATSGNVGRTITIGAYHDGRRIVAAGCMGNVVFTIANGMPMMARFTMQGKLSTIDDSALIKAAPGWIPGAAWLSPQQPRLHHSNSSTTCPNGGFSPWRGGASHRTGYFWLFGVIYL